GAKEIALEESIRLPVFIRYPKWFNAGTVVTDEIASNIDFAPTFLELAGIPDTFGMDGLSLHSLVTHEASRKQFLYEVAGIGPVPGIRAVRSLQYKYIYNYCTHTAEEFYDLVNDPNENDNLINNSSYSVLIDSFRAVMDSLRDRFTDDINIPVINCFTAFPTPQKGAFDEEEEEYMPDFSISMSPAPASQSFTIHCFGELSNEKGTIEVINSLG